MRRSSRRFLGLGTATVVAGAMTLVAGPAWSETPGTTTASASSSTSTSTSTASTASGPSVAEMDATGNHVMGAGIAAHTGQTRVAADLPVGSTSLRTTAQAAAAAKRPTGKINGMDVSAWQPNVDFTAAYGLGARFAYIKATEGVSYVSSTYASQYRNAKNAGFIRGGYVYAQPSKASGAATANYFFAHGGQWTADGVTLPPLLDIEYGTAAQGVCYGKSWPQMRSWIADFSATVYKKTHRYPAIYTTTDWWKRCTNNSIRFSKNPLFVAIYPVKDFSGPGTLGASWKSTGWRFWQWAASGTLPGDQDVYRSADGANLRAFAKKTE